MDDPSSALLSCRRQLHGEGQAVFAGLSWSSCGAWWSSVSRPGATGLSTVLMMIVIVLTQRPLLAYFRGEVQCKVRSGAV